jgi:hypothetical protein
MPFPYQVKVKKLKLLINQEMKDVLVFHYLPISWYRHPIPNDIREFWYQERPDILDYMQKAYKDLDIQFLPDKIIQQTNLVTQHNSVYDSISTEILAKENLFQSNDFFNHLWFIDDNFSNFLINHVNHSF